MTKNKMNDIAKIIGVEFDKPFKIINLSNKYKINERGLIYLKNNCIDSIVLRKLLTGEYEIEKPILDDVEKRYLENVLKPFKDKVNYLIKHNDRHKGYYIIVTIYEEDSLLFPYFKKNKMYKGMEVNKRYSLKELGLFEEE